MSNSVPQDVVEAFYFANTPAYLFKKLIGSSYLTSLASASSEALLQKIEAYEGGAQDSIPDAYAALLAFTRKEGMTSALTAASKAKRLEWASALLLLYSQKIPSETIANFQMELQPKDGPVEALDNPSEVQTTYLELKGHV